MITYLRLGHYGFLGNQMFQYAAVKSVALHNGYELRIPSSPEIQIHNVFDFPDQPLRQTDVDGLRQLVKEPYFHFCPESFSAPDYSTFEGYYQSEKYFGSHSAGIRESLQFKPSIIEEASRIHDSASNGQSTVSIHVRRGDYLKLPDHHPTCTMDYYKRAIDLISEKTETDYRYLVFSDDPEWCKSNFLGDQYWISEKHPAGIDMKLMTLCDHNIVANSSFSWWGGWLNSTPDKVVVAPMNWFGPKGPQDSQDLVPASWLRV